MAIHGHHGATGSGRDLPSRRSYGRGHHLCKQVFSAEGSAAVTARQHVPDEASQGRPTATPALIPKLIVRTEQWARRHATRATSRDG